MRCLTIAVALAAVGGAAVPAIAGPLTIAPTTIQIAPERHSAVVQVTNDGDTPVALQFRAYDWRQADGRDVLTPAATLAVSPAIATVPAHGTQLFRVVEQGDAPLATERSWRLRLNEIPTPGATGIGVALEFSLPVFRTPAGAASRLEWQVANGAVRVGNAGGRRARLAGLASLLPDGRRFELTGVAGAYLLAGGTRSFALEQPLAAGARLAGLADTGPIDVAPVRLVTR